MPCLLRLSISCHVRSETEIIAFHKHLCLEKPYKLPKLVANLGVSNKHHSFIGKPLFKPMIIVSTNKPVDPKFPGTGLSDIKKSFEKIAMTFLARTKIKGIYHQSYLCLY
jgi:hypothetical protein